jgi:RNA polymerase sigma-70 factor (ECF subfamily)
VEFSETRWSWVEAARDGDEDAVRSFVLKYRPAVVGYLRRRGSEREAEDLAQDVFLRLFSEGALQTAHASKGRLRSLIFAVTQHVQTDFIRRQTALKRGGGQAHAVVDHDTLAAPTPDPAFDQDWLRTLIDLAMERLAEDHPNYHEAVRLFLLEELPQAQVAERLGQTVGNVKNLVRRGKRKLKAYLSEEVWAYAEGEGAFAEELTYLSGLLPERLG